MENTCIKVLSLEHGKKVLAYYQSLKIHGSQLSWNMDQIGCYYGIFNERFNYQSYSGNSKEITLPDPLSFPRWMMVYDTSITTYKRLVIADLGPQIAYRYIAINENYEKNYQAKDVDIPTTAWKHAKEIVEEEPKLTELTLKEIAEKLNIPVSQLRIKE